MINKMDSQISAYKARLEEFKEIKEEILDKKDFSKDISSIEGLDLADKTFVQ